MFEYEHLSMHDRHKCSSFSTMHLHFVKELNRTTHMIHITLKRLKF